MSWKKAVAPVWASAFLFLISSFSSAHATPIGVSPESLQAIADSPEWLTLLHFRTPFLRSRARSEADGSTFFLSLEGRVDARAELIATLRAFAERGRMHPVGAESMYVQCAFPARMRFLRARPELAGYFKDLGISSCLELETWKSRLAAEKLSVVYAAAYTGSPASLFGHTFIRVHSSKRGDAQLLDQAIGFEAFTAGDAGGVGYVVLGLLGGYPGVFGMQPYSLKVSAYTNMESRDLWEYELALSAEEIERVLEHAWEMAGAHFDYYFFDENCSYHLMGLLESARPGLVLRDRFFWMTIPVDTLKALRGAGLIADVRRRPSILAKLRERLRRLTPHERARFSAEKESPRLNGNESAELLDAWIDWQQQRSAEETQTLGQSLKPIQPELLGARARAESHLLAQELSRTSQTAPQPPDLGHGSTKVSVFGGSAGRPREGRKPVLGLEFRPVFHDFLDRDVGYHPYSELTIARTRIEWQPEAARARFALTEFTAAQVATLAPWSDVARPLSWRVGGGISRPADRACESCIAFGVLANAGVSGEIRAGAIHVLGFLWGGLHAQGSGEFAPWGRAVPLLESGAFLSPTDRLKIKLGAARSWVLLQQDLLGRDLHFWTPEIRASLGLDSWEIRGGAEWILHDQARELDSSQATLEIGFYL